LLSKVTASPLLKVLAVVLLSQLAAPPTFQRFAVPSPFHTNWRAVITMLELGVALASRRFRAEAAGIASGDDIIIGRAVGEAVFV